MTPAWSATPAHPAAAPQDDERVSEFAGLLAAQQAEAPAPAYTRTAFPRASFPRTGPQVRAGGPLVDDEDEPADGLPAPSAPSPFTAALARMVAGDQDVRQAVKEALDQPSGAFARAVAAPSPARPAPIAQSSVTPPAAPQEEETVGDQVVAPPSPVMEHPVMEHPVVEHPVVEQAVVEHPVEVPTWAAEPEVTAASVSPREEAIADLLRGALAQGHSDEALAGILRKVLAGASPQTALTEPELPAPLPAPQVALADIALADIPLTDIALTDIVLADEAPVDELPRDLVVETAPETVALVDVAEPVADLFVHDDPVEVVAEDVVAEDEFAAEPAAPVYEPTYYSSYDATGLFGDVAPAAKPSLEMWGIELAEVPLWGEPVAAAPSSDDEPIWRPVVSDSDLTPVDDAPIWAEVALQEPVAGADEHIETDSETATDEVVPVEVEVEVEVEEFVSTTVAEVEELAPVLARTASDPAPMMSLDTTTVMPPLSLLPPLPSSRGSRRGRPPVPMSPSRSSRPAVPPPSAPPAASAPESTAPVAPETTPAEMREETSGTDTVQAESTRVDAGLFDDAPTVTTPAAKSSAPRPPVVETSSLPAPAPRLLATVTRLPVAPQMATLEPADEVDEPVAPAAEIEVPEPAPTALFGPAVHGDIAGRLEALGVPAGFLAASFADDVAVQGTYAALTRALALKLPKAPELPNGAGEVLFVVGPGVETLRTAQSLAASLRLDPDRVQWATRGDLAGLAPKGSRMTTVETAIDRRQDAADAGTITIVAVDAPLRTDSYWMSQMLAIWAPVAVWAVVEATRKPEDLLPWIDGLPRVDALVVQDTDLSADPAAVLRRVDIPVALLDGVPATPHRWASLLCERLESVES
ncbi:hypothetical protein E4P40_22510 [Blastococcus sp. CT_GayMR20]|nr:hypothetical protein E4P40_22510 [Blastococcus sp. CT_GayMR20]